MINSIQQAGAGPGQENSTAVANAGQGASRQDTTAAGSKSVSRPRPSAEALPAGQTAISLVKHSHSLLHYCKRIVRRLRCRCRKHAIPLVVFITMPGMRSISRRRVRYRWGRKRYSRPPSVDYRSL